MRDITERQSFLKERLDESFGEIIWEKVVDSTNNVACGLALKGTESVVVANSQTSGRGRLGREFISDEGGLYISIGVCLNEIFPKVEAPDLNMTLHFPLLAALAVTDAIQNVTNSFFGVDIMPDIKWPNDIQINRKKIGGILCKAAYSGGRWFIVIGIGIDVNNILPSELTEASNLASELNIKEKEDTDWGSFTEELAAETAALVRKTLKKGIDNSDDLLDEVESRCVTIGKKVEVPERGITGIARSIGSDGSLCIETGEDEYEVIKSGDVIIYI